MGFPSGSVIRNPPECRRCGFHPWIEKIPWRRKWQPAAVFLPGEAHGTGSLAGHSPWDREPGGPQSMGQRGLAGRSPGGRGAWRAAVQGAEGPGGPQSRGQRGLAGRSPGGREPGELQSRGQGAWRAAVQGAEEPGMLPSVGSHRVGHDRAAEHAPGTLALGRRRCLNKMPCHRVEEGEGLQPRGLLCHIKYLLAWISLSSVISELVPRSIKLPRRRCHPPSRPLPPLLLPPTTFPGSRAFPSESALHKVCGREVTETCHLSPRSTLAGW